MSRAQMTVLAVVVGIAIFLGVAVTLALLVFSVMSTRDIVRLDSQVREMTSVVSALSHSLQEASSSSEHRLETLNQTLDNATTSADRRLVSLNNSFASSLHQLSHEVSTNQTALAQQHNDLARLMESALPKSCQHYRDNGHGKSGVYSLNLRDGGRPFLVYCDMETDSYGWLVFQRRIDGSEDFYRTWADYKAGFGRLESEFWLGNDKLHRLTSAGLTRLRVDLGDWLNGTASALYSSFSVAGEGDNYRLGVSGNDANSTAGDSFTTDSGTQFSTKDRDNDRMLHDTCTTLHRAGWWHNICTNANLNGPYTSSPTSEWLAIFWYSWKRYTPLKSTAMKIR